VSDTSRHPLFFNLAIMKENTKKHLWIIICITILNALGMTIVLPLFPFLLNEYVSNKEVAGTMSVLVSIFALSQFFSSPIFGALSDRYGRKPILLFSMFGSAIGYFLLGIGGALWVLFLGRIIDGLTAGNQSTLFAYVSDSTELEERGKWFGYLGGAIGVGFMIGPAIGGFLGSFSITLPFYATAVLTLLSMLFTYFLLPESLKEEKRSAHLALKSINTFSHFNEVFAIKKARLLIIMGAFFYLGLGIWQFNTSIFLKDVFEWGPKLIGSVFVMVGICDILSRVILLPFLLKKWNEKTVGMIGLFGLAVGLALLFISSYIHSIYFIAGAVACIVLGEGLFDPSYNAKISVSVEDSQQGLLQGVNQSLQALYRVIVPIGAALIYTYNQGVVFGIASVLMVVGMVLFRRMR
jgi:DHA1 family tetracycline resistance protein-like MFS transporter